MDADVALLQEMHPGGYEWLRTAKDGVAVSPQEPWALWDCYDRWPLVVKLSHRVRVEWFRQTIPTRWVEAHEVAVSGVGTVATAKVIPMDDGEPFIAVSMYARWYEPKPTDGTGWFYPDTSAHRIISDLTVFINSPVFSGYEDNPKHRVLAAGDLNMDFDFGHGTSDFAFRANTVFDRMNALGLEYIGPQHPNGRRADLIPEHLSEDTRNVVTYYPGNSPETARLQLRVYSGKGQNRTLRSLNLLSALWPPVFAGEQDMGQELGLYRQPGVFPLFDCFAEMGGIPGNDDGGEQVKSGHAAVLPSLGRSRISPWRPIRSSFLSVW